MNEIPVSLDPMTTILEFLTIFGSLNNLLVINHKANGASSSSR